MTMRKNRRNFVAILAAAGMLVLILDSKLVLIGASEGIKLCLWTVIPSLFPFFVVSALISSNIGSHSNGFLRLIGKLCKIPAGSESILLTGFLGGYPIGAQSIVNGYHNGVISRKDATRMLSFCNNAGPAFIFGMVSQQFESAVAGWFLWLITMLSAIFVAISVPGVTASYNCMQRKKTVSFSQIMTNAIKSMANVCAWVVLFRIILILLQKRIFKDQYNLLQSVLFGFLELSNGIIQTASVSSPHIRFVLCAVFLSAGGFCVAMQTYSTVTDLGIFTYIVGKVLQTAYSLLLSLSMLPFVFSDGRISISLLSAIICAILLLLTQVFKKCIAIYGKVLYNIKN